MRSSCARRHGSRDAGGVLRRDAVAGFLVVDVVAPCVHARRSTQHSICTSICTQSPWVLRSYAVITVIRADAISVGVQNQSLKGMAQCLRSEQPVALNGALLAARIVFEI